MKFKTLQDKLMKLDIESIAIAAVKETKDEITKLNVEQMYAGKRSDGLPITPAYAPSTVRRKKRQHKPYARVTLRDKGPFHDAAFTEVTGSKIKIGSTDPKTPFLEARYENIWGLNEQYKPRYIKILKPLMRKKLSKATGLK